MGLDTKGLFEFNNELVQKAKEGFAKYVLEPICRDDSDLQDMLKELDAFSVGAMHHILQYSITFQSHHGKVKIRKKGYQALKVAVGDRPIWSFQIKDNVELLCRELHVENCKFLCVILFISTSGMMFDDSKLETSIPLMVQGAPDGSKMYILGYTAYTSAQRGVDYMDDILEEKVDIEDFSGKYLQVIASASNPDIKDIIENDDSDSVSFIGLAFLPPILYDGCLLARDLKKGYVNLNKTDLTSQPVELLSTYAAALRLMVTVKGMFNRDPKHKYIMYTDGYTTVYIYDTDDGVEFRNMLVGDDITFMCFIKEQLSNFERDTIKEYFKNVGAKNKKGFIWEDDMFNEHVKKNAILTDRIGSIIKVIDRLPDDAFFDPSSERVQIFKV